MNVVPLHSANSKGGVKPAYTSQIITALDVGSTKICCLIARVEKSSNKNSKQPMLRVLGVGHHAASGVRGGVVSDVDQAERSIRMAVDAAERMAQISINEVYVNVSGGRPKSVSLSGCKSVQSETVDQHDVNDVIGIAMQNARLDGRILLHASPIQFDIDDAKGVRDPRGMYGDRLGVDVNAVMVEPGSMRNLAMVIERCHLSVASFVIAPYAAGKSALVEDELELGTTLIDMGGATTSVGVFYGGHLIYGDVVPIGGHHITKDLARGLSTTIAHAERMKVLYGSALPSIYDDREIVSVPLLGERGVDKINQVPRSMLTGIIRPRLDEIFEMVHERLETSPVANKLGRSVVLSGGSAQLTGMREAAAQILGRNVRITNSHRMQGLPESSKSPAFSVATGLLNYALSPDRHTSQMMEFGEIGGQSNNYFNRVGRWIKDSF